MAIPQATESSGRRTAQGAKTRSRLLEFGRKAFARRGHTGTNLKEDILLPAGVSVGSFYHQFKAKTDLFLVILRSTARRFGEWSTTRIARVKA